MEPSPIWPKLLRPHVRTVPSGISASACSRPAATSIAPVMSFTGRRGEVGLVGAVPELSEGVVSPRVAACPGRPRAAGAAAIAHISTTDKRPTIDDLFRSRVPPHPSRRRISPLRRPRVDPAVIPPRYPRSRRRSSPSTSWPRCRRSGSARRVSCRCSPPTRSRSGSRSGTDPTYRSASTGAAELDPVPAGRQDHPDESCVPAKSDRTISRPSSVQVHLGDRLRSRPPCGAGSGRALVVLFVTFTLALTQTVVSVVDRSSYANAVCAVGFPRALGRRRRADRDVLRDPGHGVPVRQAPGEVVGEHRRGHGDRSGRHLVPLVPGLVDRLHVIRVPASRPQARVGVRQRAGRRLVNCAIWCCASCPSRKTRYVMFVLTLSIAAAQIRSMVDVELLAPVGDARIAGRRRVWR